MAFGFGKTHIPYDMFDVERSADEAKRFAKCERIYHRGQEIAWDGKEILPMLLDKHGGLRIDDDTRRALQRILLGGPGWLPTQGSHRPGRARLTHPVHQSTVLPRE